ncbi:MAG: S-layer homology domain-containing protein, partial [Clostridia bacterium]|nr:S-layer homology domain-containing protein [Clostridia bacterium]
MKKIPALLLVFVMILQLGIFSVSAEADIITLKGDQYSSGTPSQKDTNTAMVRPSAPLGWKVTLPYTSGAMKLTYRTADGENGILRIRLGGINGEVLGILNTYEIAHSWSETYENTIGFTRPISGENEIWITVEKPATGGGGGHWINSLEFLEFDATKTLGDFSMSDAFADIAEDPNKHEINLLTDLGLYDKNEVNFIPYQPMTRLDFVGILGKLIKAEQYTAETSPFKDVKPGSENADLLSGLYVMGIIKGDTEGNFRPTDFITPQEAAIVCTNALGYQSFAKDMNVILDLANTLGILDGLKLTNKVTKSDAAKLIYNLLLADYLAVQEMSSNDVFYNPTKNYLEKATEYRHSIGVMTANTVTGLYAAKKSDSLKIDNEAYVVKTGIDVNYLGVKCEFFYHEEDGERVLDAIRPVPKAQWSTVQSTPDIRFDIISERELKYTVVSDDEEFEYELDAKTAIIYNGVALSKSLATLISDPADFEGSITLIDNNADGLLEAVWIDHVSRIIKVGAVSSGRIKDDITGTLYDTNKSDFVLFIGTKSSYLDELKNGTILTVFESDGTGKDKYIRAMADENDVEGQITSYSNGKYTINDTEYKVSPVCTDDLYVGLTGTFMLDRFDYIIYCEEGVTSEAKVGAYLANDSGEPTALESYAMVKLLTETGVEKLKVAKRVIADGVTIKSVDDFYDGVGAFTGLTNVASNSPVLYRLNTAGEISMIDTINDGAMDSNDQLVNILDTPDANPINGVMSQAFRVYNSTLSNDQYEPQHGVKSKAKVLALSETGNEIDHKILEGLAGSDDDINIAPYATRRDTMIADVILIKNYVKLSNTPAATFVVDRIADAVDDEGNVVKKIYGYSSGAKVEYIVDADSYSSNSALKTLVDSLYKGNLVTPFLTRNKITKLLLAYIPDVAPGEKFGPQTNAAGVEAKLHKEKREASKSNLEGASALYLGEVVAIEENFVKVNVPYYDDQGTTDEGDDVWATREWVYNGGSAKVTLC